MKQKAISGPVHRAVSRSAVKYEGKNRGEVHPLFSTSRDSRLLPCTDRVEIVCTGKPYELDEKVGSWLMNVTDDPEVPSPEDSIIIARVKMRG